MELNEFIQEKKGVNVLRGLVSAIATLAMGAVVLGFFFDIGDDLVDETGFNETYHKIQDKGALILYAGVIVPLALLMGTALAIFT